MVLSFMLIKQSTFKEFTEERKFMKKIVISILSLFVILTTAEITDTNIIQTKEAKAYGSYGYSSNPYYWGSCAYYAYNRRAQLGRPVGKYWGNAKNWAYNARRAGYKVSRKPKAGAVMQTTQGYYGHVAVVERINRNGSILVSEMNFPYQGVKTYRTISKYQKSYYNYIY